MSFLDINGFQLNYEKFTGISDHNVLFIHGNLASNEWWHPSIELMKAQGTEKKGTVLCADWRGYGKSKGITDASQINFKKFAQDYIFLIESSGLKNINVVGHSTGGLIAMLAIIKRPDLFRSLILLDSVGPTGVELELPKEQILAHFDRMSKNKTYCSQVLATTIEGCDPESSTFKRLVDITWNCDKPMWTGVIEVLSDKIDIRADMNQVSLPALVLHGDKDLVLPMKLAELNHSLLPDSELRVLIGRGHSYNMEDPQGFVNDAEDFWSSLNN